MTRVMGVRTIRYAGRDFAPGEPFEASEQDARVLLACALCTEAPAEVPEEVPEEDAKPKKAVYKRRDLSAEV